MSKSLGELQQLAMLAVVRLGEAAYGARIRAELKDVAGREVSISAIYVTLVRLEEQGLVESRSGSHPDRGGRRRRCFRLTAAGLERLWGSRQAANQMWTGVERELFGGEMS